ncbi:response regulator transcription factor [Leucobacter sp. USHLN153]|uniref:response regulator transcription factor n=1 Tax=Leucobacter sp. USHLN153 TaxID=3081268 RepID=UPI003017F43C
MIRVLLVDDQALVRSGFRIILESEPDIEVVGEAENGERAVELASELAPDVICMDVEMPVLDGISATRRILGAPASVRAGAGDHAVRGAAAMGSRDDGDASASGVAAAPAVLVLTTFGHEKYLFDALAAGVSGFLLKTSRAEQLIDAVRSLAAGDALLGPDVTRAVIERVAADRASAAGTHDPASTHSTDAAEAAVATLGDRARPGSLVAEIAGSTVAASAAADPARAAMKDAGLTEREREVLALLAEGKSNGEIAADLYLGEATIKTHVSNVLQKLGVRDRIQAVVWAHTRG